MQLGFVSAILPELSLEEVLRFAADESFACVEVMCWPPGKTDRRYAGVSHINVAEMTEDYAGHIRELVRMHGVAISGLGYYPNPLDADVECRRFVGEHLRRVIRAAARINVGLVNTFIGRDPLQSVEANWPNYRSVWPEIIRHAEGEGINLGIENCPMLFTADEWPGGKNLAVSPAVWQLMFEEISSPRLGLNFDPSHFIWQQLDYVRAIREFGRRIYHVHAKDTRVDKDRLGRVGIMGLGWHTAKLPGLGDVDWGEFFSALTDVGYDGAVCIEVEDRAYENSLKDRKRALLQSKRFLDQFIS